MDAATPQTDEEAGKNAVLEAAAGLSLEPGKFLLDRCAVYCIAV